MLKTTKFLSAFFALTLLFSFGSCGDSASSVGGTSDVSNSIPADATGVLLMNTKQLMEKADYAELKQTSFFKDWIKEAKKEAPEMVPFLNDPEAAGISLAGNIGMYFSLSDDFLKNQKTDVALILPVADKAKMETAVKAALEKSEGATSETKDGYIITKINADGNLIQSDKILAFTSFDDDAKIQRLINPTGENIRSNDSFNKHIKEGKDIMFWIGADPIVEAALKDPSTARNIKGSLAGAQIPEESLKGNYMSFYYDFQKGEMDAGMAFDFNELLIQEFGGIFPNKLAVDYSNYIPTENLAAATTIGISPAGILNFIAKRGMDQFADMYLAQMNMNLGEIRNGITGDMAIGIYAPATPESDPVVVAALGVKDKAFVEELITQAGPMVNKDGDKYTFTGSQSMMNPDEAPMQIVAIIKDDVLLISNSNEHLDKALVDNNNTVVNEMQNGWMGMYLNYALINKNYDAIADILPMDPSALVLSKMLSKYQSVSSSKIIATGDKVGVKTILENKNQNSLKSLIQAGDKMYQDRDKIEAEMKKQMEDEFEDFDEKFGTDEENT